MALSSPKPDATPNPLFRMLVTAFIAAAACGCSAVSVHPGPLAPAVPTVQTAVNLNTADASELERLEGIGPRTAEKIVRHRIEFGGFQRPAEIMLVEGIGEKQFLKIRDKIRTE